MKALNVCVKDVVEVRDGKRYILSPIQAVRRAYEYCGIAIPADLHWAAVEARAPSFSLPEFALMQTA